MHLKTVDGIEEQIKIEINHSIQLCRHIVLFLGTNPEESQELYSYSYWNNLYR